MPLKLVTGPANSAKAGEVLGGYRARLADEPMLVVPAFGDVEHSQRELAAGGAVLGARVVRFDWLFEAIAERTGYREPRASQVRRELVAEEAVRAAPLRVLTRSAERRGFVRAAVRFFAELERAMVEPQRLWSALRAWSAGGPRSEYAEEVGELYSRYRAGLDAAGLVDGELFAWRALDALRERPDSWGATPLFVYGFDDFTGLELAALEALAGGCGADVTVSLPYEPERVAFRATERVLERLRQAAGEQVELPASADHYAPESRAPLHHVERRLFDAGGAELEEPGTAVRLLSAGGERAEVELVAAEVLRLLREGTPAGEVAVVFREPSRYGSVVEQVFGAYGIPFAIDRRVPLSHTALGRGLLALVRSAAMGGTDDDLLAYLRTAGVLDLPQLADRLEADARTTGAYTASQARAVWEDTEGRWVLRELDRLREAAAPPAFLRELDSALERLFAGPYTRTAPVLGGEELDDARVFRAARAALADLRAAADAGLAVDAERVHDTLAELPVRLGEDPQPGRVQVAAPGAIRARRFAAVFICGLQEGEFPRGTRPEPFLADADRRAIAAASGLVLPLREDQLERERYLFYVCASRAERLLALSCRHSDEEGNPELASSFRDEVERLFGPALGESETGRSLSEVTWPPGLAPTAREWERAVALAGPRRTPALSEDLSSEELLVALREREAFSAGTLEAFAGCPVRWLVEKLIEPGVLEPDPEYLVRGDYAHQVLELTYRRLQERTGERRVTPGNVAEAERIAVEALHEKAPEFHLSRRQARVRAAIRRLEFDLIRYLRHDAERGGRFEPAELELSFGLGEESHEAVDVGGVKVRGRIDRVDTWDGYALVRDYKSGKTVFPVAKWKEDNRLQAAVYMLAVRELLGLDVAGGVYEPLAGEERRPRGMVRASLSDELGPDFFPKDRVSDEEFEDQLAHARDSLCDLVGRLRAGEVRPCPETCAWNGGCSHPSICRIEG